MKAREMIEATGMTLTAIADDTGYSVSYMSTIKNGRRAMPQIVRLYLMEAYEERIKRQKKFMGS